jgi:uncharacterized membrane protein (GlpM family)
MWQYLLYFLIGGTVVVLVSYIGSRGSGILAAFVASLPIITLLNIFIMYRGGGVDASLTYAKGVLLFLPAFAFCVALTIWLLPRLGMPSALAAGLPIYLLPLVIMRSLGRRMTPLPKQRNRFVNSSGVIVRRK